MDIFKLGEKILDLLEIVFGFWNHQASLVFHCLGSRQWILKEVGRGEWWKALNLFL